jgi:two-component system nitrogen regulation sensor histidine kinase NtrY
VKSDNENIKSTKSLVSKRLITTLFLLLSILSLLFSIFPTFFPNSSQKEDLHYNNTTYNIDYVDLSPNTHSTELVKYLKNNPTRIEYLTIDSITTQNNLLCFIYKNDSLIYWNNTTTNPYNIDLLNVRNSPVAVNLPSGRFLAEKHDISGLTAVILDKVAEKNNYTTLDSETGQTKTENHKQNSYCIFTFLLFIIFTYILLTRFLISSCARCIFSVKASILILFSVLIILVVFIGLIPDSGYVIETLSLQVTKLFTKSELLIISIVLTLLPISIFSVYKNLEVHKINSSYQILFRYLGLILYTLLAVQIITISTTLLDFRIFDGASSLTRNIGFALIVVTLINTGIYFIYISYFINKNHFKVSVIIPLLIGLFTSIIAFLIFDLEYITVLISFSLYGFFILLHKFIWFKLNDLLIKNLIIIILQTAFTSIIINTTLENKSDDYQEFLATTLNSEEDAKLEKEIKLIIPKIKSDQNIITILNNDTSNIAVSDYLLSHYFQNNLTNYNIQITICDNNERIEIQPEMEVYNCWDYFNSLIADFTIPTIDSSLYRFSNSVDGYYYIAKIPIYLDSIERNYNIYIELITSFVPEGLGYPELLITNHEDQLNLYGFSYAVFEDNMLIYKFGDFNYNTVISDSDKYRDNSFTYYDGFKHYTLINLNGKTLLVSKKLLPVSLKLFTYSFTFLLLAIVGVIIYFITSGRRAINLFRSNFKTRLQFFVLISLTITFTLIAVSTFLFLKENTRVEMEKQLLEKTNSVLVELQHKLSNVYSLNEEDPEMLHSILRKFSLVFFSDINLYDESGGLIATSRPEVFDKNLLSPMVNPHAYKAIFTDNELSYITEEKIGDIKYYSSYVPLNLDNIYPIGILNLPYFARQNEYTLSYYIMLSYLINIYVILGILTTIMAVIFARYLTKPLVLLKDSISSIRIDQQNERIQWKSDDEIGILIHEYNRMVHKLEQSAELLIRSERESAWREIAKQIAHEIKNPLTPMKLNVQYLEKAFNSNDPDFSSKLKQVSNSLITQIDTLNNVAEMFSDFAKNTVRTNEKTDLKKIIKLTSQLFNKKQNITIAIDIQEEESFIVLGNENDLQRVINNIVKNAIQAIGDEKTGFINIELAKNNDQAILSIKDNGKGMNNETKQKIFQPYFTTKNSGTGLGLAIVKNIINESDGEIMFESEEGKGTNFTIKLKLSD